MLVSIISELSRTALLGSLLSFDLNFNEASPIMPFQEKNAPANIPFYSPDGEADIEPTIDA